MVMAFWFRISILERKNVATWEGPKKSVALRRSIVLGTLKASGRPQTPKVYLTTGGFCSRSKQNLCPPYLEPKITCNNCPTLATVPKRQLCYILWGSRNSGASPCFKFRALSLA